MTLAAHTSRRSRGTAVGLGLLSLVAACAVNLPPPQTPVAGTRNGEAIAALPKVERGGSTGEAPYGHGGSAVWEESEIEQAAALAPTPETQAATPTPEQLAAIAPAATPQAAETDGRIGSAAEPESLLSHIGPTTPPNVTAALRLIEDGRQQMRQGRYDQAIDRFERAVAIDPTNAYGYYFLAQLHYRNISTIRPPPSPAVPLHSAPAAIASGQRAYTACKVPCSRTSGATRMPARPTRKRWTPIPTTSRPASVWHG